MESQMVQNSRNKIGFTFNKFVIKVKADFNQAQQNQFTFNQFSLKVKTFRIKLNKITSSLSRNYLSRARDIWVKLKRLLTLLSRKIYLNFTLRFISTPNSLSHFSNLTIQGQAVNAVNNHAKHCQQSSKQILCVLFMKYLPIVTLGLRSLYWTK